MRTLSVSIAVLAGLAFTGSLRADYGLWIVTPENVAEVEGLSVEANTDSFGVIRFVVRSETVPAPKDPPEGRDWLRYQNGLLRLEVAENVWTEANVVADAREGATEYGFAVAPAHLDIATFNLVRTEGLGGEWYEIRLKEFIPKATAAEPAKGEPKAEAPTADPAEEPVDGPSQKPTPVDEDK